MLLWKNIQLILTILVTFPLMVLRDLEVFKIPILEDQMTMIQCNISRAPEEEVNNQLIEDGGEAVAEEGEEGLLPKIQKLLWMEKNCRRNSRRDGDQNLQAKIRG